jgi:hypothetical protein
MIISKVSANFLDKIFDNHTDQTEINSTKRLHPTASKIRQVLREMNIKGKDCKLIRIEETSNKLAVPPHADASQEYESVIVPLCFTGSVHTILFKSLYLGKGTSKGYKYRPTKNKYYDSEWLSSNNELCTGLIDKPFTDKKYKPLLSYLPKADLFGLQIAKIIKWKERKAFKFDSNQLHSGSNFKGKKRWLLIIKKQS